eukprot:7192080-Pyramimonas_sp.AAC.2
MHKRQSQHGDASRAGGERTNNENHCEIAWSGGVAPGRRVNEDSGGAAFRAVRTLSDHPIDIHIDLPLTYH